MALAGDPKEECSLKAISREDRAIEELPIDEDNLDGAVELKENKSNE